MVFPDLFFMYEIVEPVTIGCIIIRYPHTLFCFSRMYSIQNI